MQHRFELNCLAKLDIFKLHIFYFNFKTNQLWIWVEEKVRICCGWVPGRYPMIFISFYSGGDKISFSFPVSCSGHVFWFWRIWIVPLFTLWYFLPKFQYFFCFIPPQRDRYILVVTMLSVCLRLSVLCVPCFFSVAIWMTPWVSCREAGYQLVSLCFFQ